MTTSQLPATRVLIVEDEEELRDAMISFLALEGLAAQGVGSLDATESWMQSQDFDVLVLDLGLPDGDGLAWLAQRKELQDKGVIITTARSLGQERVSGVKAGADVYLVKPVLLEELSSLIRNLARRIQPSAAAPAWTLDLLAWLILSPDGQIVKLTHSEHTLLGALARAPGKTVPRNELIFALGHDPLYYDQRRMEILVRRLRTKVRDQLGYPLPLETVHSQGLAFTAPVTLRGK